MNIPLTKPYWGKPEEKAVVDAIRHSNGVGDGVYTKKLVKSLQKITGTKYVFPTTSATHGLELTMAVFQETGSLNPGDEVILPSFTMTSTANCVVLHGGIPVFADIEPLFYNIDPVDIESKITPKTRGIIVVHYAGMPCQMDRIKAIARKYHLWVVEDAAHAIGATYKSKMLGTWGDVGVYSFHGTKNVTCGEGGAVLTGDEKIATQMEIYRANGTNRKAFLDGVVDKYSWVGKGSSFYLSDVLASILISQVNQIKTINIKRNQIATFYSKQLQKYSKIIILPTVPADTQPNWHIFAIKFKQEKQATLFMQKMRAKGIEVSRHYVPLHTSIMGRKIYNSHSDRIPLLASGGRSGGICQVEDPSTTFTLSEVEGLGMTKIKDPSTTFTLSEVEGLGMTNKKDVLAHVTRYQSLSDLESQLLPITDEVSRTLVRLPIYPGLTKTELSYIITSARKIFNKI